MQNPVFTLGSNVLDFGKGYSLPTPYIMERTQAVDRTAAGSLQVESLGIKITRRTLTFGNLSLSLYEQTLNWYENIAAGSANAFTFTDMDGVDHTARWMNNFNFQEDFAGYSGSIELEIED